MRAGAALVAALGSQDAAIRAAAARAVNALRLSQALQAVREAVATESAPSPLFEEVSALLVLDPQAGEGIALDAAERLRRGGHDGAADAVILHVVRALGPKAVDRFPRTGAISGSVDTWRAWILAATPNGREGVSTAASTLLASGDAISEARSSRHERRGT